jgi:hypothetical protein
MADFQNPLQIKLLRGSARDLGKGEVVSSILPGSTRKALVNRHFLHRAPPFPLRFDRERIAKLPQKPGENAGTLFAGRSASPQRRARQ